MRPISKWLEEMSALLEFAKLRDDKEEIQDLVCKLTTKVRLLDRDDAEYLEYLFVKHANKEKKCSPKRKL